MDHDHQMSGNSGMSTTKRYTHMTFFWGKNSEILFTQWPGTRTGMYVLALIILFVLTFLMEWLSHCRLIKSRSNSVAAGLLRTVLHTLHVGLAYLVMLALMSFNVGVLIVAIAGHAAGFFVFGSRIFKRGEKSGEESDLGPPLKC
ncbi:PREDICTED: copper transporter 2-like [Nelumbo nucifera]|uniref:Copper transport protein n=1 Tax=Nelumbo nucifera TaxID=4432 RepID=A0A1U8A628_NELNU|nr:PREDICTED: copper transporter 2-like [Nelumbo nucifera]